MEIENGRKWYDVHRDFERRLFAYLRIKPYIC